MFYGPMKQVELTGRDVCRSGDLCSCFSKYNSTVVHQSLSKWKTHIIHQCKSFCFLHILHTVASFYVFIVSLGLCLIIFIPQIFYQIWLSIYFCASTTTASKLIILIIIYAKHFTKLLNYACCPTISLRIQARSDY